MGNEDFQWGPLARGLYIAMLWLTVLVGWHFSHLLYHYVALLIFLGLCLKPLLVVTGLAERLSIIADRFHEARWGRVTRQRRAQVARKERDKRHRYSHYKNPRLPEKW
jgi:hypothetical protein